MLNDRHRTVLRQSRQLVAELRRAPSGRSLFAGVLVGLAARAFGADGGVSRAAGLTVGAATWRTVATAAQLEREVRASQDGAIVAARLGVDCPPLGTWAIEADFAELLTVELQKRPRVVVELGSGVSTLVVAQQLKALGSGRLVSVEHEEEYAASTRHRLERSGLGGAVELIHAPLVAQEFGGQEVEWYDLTPIRAALGDDPIDLLIVDGPPSISPLARWPAVAALGQKLRAGGVIMLDDGRAKYERAIARRWPLEQPDLELYWQDTVKGTWKLVRSAGSESASTKRARRAATALNPRPSGFGRWPVRRA
jgi:predicted O-methyltransferase YrrM